MSATDYEFSLRCPDGEVWPDEACDLGEARGWLRTADSDCGCGESPHIIVRRPVEDWEPLLDNGSVVDSDRDETRSARLHSLALGDRHPPDCTCNARSCMQDRSGMSDAESGGAS